MWTNLCWFLAGVAALPAAVIAQQFCVTRLQNRRARKAIRRYMARYIDPV